MPEDLNNNTKPAPAAETGGEKEKDKSHKTEKSVVRTTDSKETPKKDPAKVSRNFIFP